MSVINPLYIKSFVSVTSQPPSFIHEYRLALERPVKQNHVLRENIVN